VVGEAMTGGPDYELEALLSLDDYDSDSSKAMS
jgi:hypothetical protein